MPYARRSYRRRTTRRRVPNRRTIQAIVNKTVQKRSETKFKVISQQTPFQLTNASTIDIDITNLGQSITQNGRIGNQVRWSGLYAKFAVQSETTMTNQIRIIMYIPYSADDVLGTATTPMTLIDEDKLTVLYDKTIYLNAHGAQGKILTLRKSFFRGMRKGIQSQWSDQTAGSCSRNALKMIVCTDAVSADKCMLQFQGRCYFKDY